MDRRATRLSMAPGTGRVDERLVEAVLEVLATQEDSSTGTRTRMIRLAEKLVAERHESSSVRMAGLPRDLGGGCARPRVEHTGTDAGRTLCSSCHPPASFQFRQPAPARHARPGPDVRPNARGRECRGRRTGRFGS